MSNIINLNIGGLDILLTFHQTERLYLKNKMIDEILTYYSGFKLNRSPKNIDYKIDFIVNERADIFFENKTQKNFINFYERESETRLITYYQIGIFQFQIILINILHKLLARNFGFLLHASANIVDHQAFLFLGDHGSGKSTIMKILNAKFPAVADDSAIIKKISNVFYFFQTPIIEKENWINRDRSKYKIQNLFFLHKSNKYKIEKIKTKESLIRNMLKVLWIVDKKHKNQFNLVLDFINKFDNAYNLYFGLDKARVINLFEGFKGNSS